MMQWQRLAAYFVCTFITSSRRYCDPSCLLVRVFLFVGRLVGWFVRSFVNILPTAALEGQGAFTSCTYLLYKPSYSTYSKFTLKIFVTVATGTGLRQILLPQLKWLTPKTPCLVQESRTYLLYKPSYSQFYVKISKVPLPWQRGLVRDKFY